MGKITNRDLSKVKAERQWEDRSWQSSKGKAPGLTSARDQCAVQNEADEERGVGWARSCGHGDESDHTAEARRDITGV